MAAEPRVRPASEPVAAVAAAGPRPALLALLFVLSGAASLVDQVVWLRYLSLVFGNTTLAAATLLAIFLGGLGLGALVFGRLAPRLRHPLRVYAALEIGVAAAALASPAFFTAITDAYVAVYRSVGDAPALFALLRGVLAAVCLLPPTMLMGGTLPVVLRAVEGSARNPRRVTALLYATNTLGAVGGVWLAGFVTIPRAGLSASLVLAAALSLAAAAGAILISRPTVPAAPVALPATTTRSRRTLLAVVFAMGATSLAYEVLWTRVLVFYLGSSVYAFSLMLLLFLAGIGLGSLGLAALPRRLPPLGALVAIEVALALWALAQIPLFGNLNALLVALATALDPTSFGGIAMVQLLAVGAVLLPPTLLMGVSFPLAVAAAVGSGEGDDAAAHARTSHAAGLVYGTNTLGSVVGALGIGFVAIPLLGTQRSLLLVGGVNLALALVLLGLPRPRWRRLAVAGAVAAPIGWTLLAGLFPPDRVILAAGMFRHDRPGDLVHFHEDASASVTIRRLREHAGPYLSLEINGVNVAGSSRDLYAIQKMQGHLPMLLAASPKRVVHIGFGSGGTAWAVSRHPVESVHVVELSPPVIAASDRWFAEINHGVLRDPRVSVEINDGRNFLLATPRIFDAVLSDSIHPRYAGNGTLYTREYFELARARMAPGGAVSMWLPMYSLSTRNFAMILRAFQDVFPQVAVWYEPSALNAFTVVTGRLGDAPWTAATLARAFADPQVAGELADIGIRGPADVLACYLAGTAELAPWLASVPPHVDDLPAVEYESGALLVSQPPWLATFSRLLALRPATPPADWLAALPPGERERAVRLFAARRPLLDAHRAAIAEQLARDRGLR